ncbi:chemotaxis protein CheW [Natronorubrum thiooxidans]|uniref:Chemotaxis signal transduction protein n=1 Tax=Natronorubrum thiooxidans TaxID=308853 RepID=A0A1N7DD84_9EURY|nr:chemotaxis protein CheW [Natronorubrum thiooxidans]SIR73830.1 Chemotaxis signal transduction protein [Natronorubrum thiooxidans]
MAPDLSEKLLGIDIDSTDDQRRQKTDDADENAEEFERFVFFESGEHRLAVSVDAVGTLAEVPDELTRVPRTPPAIEGMVDLRGEVTAVIDPSVHFPSDSVTDSGRERLLVLDRPTDQQSAAIRVDDVIGVETIAESDILDEAAVEDRPFSGDALTHPLVTALLEQEHEYEAADNEVVATNRPGTDSASGTGTAVDAGDTGMASATRGSLHGRSSDDAGDPFTFESNETESEAFDDGGLTREVVIEVTPLIDVETLLQASGHRKQRP